MNSYEVTYLMERKITVIAPSQHSALEQARRELNHMSPSVEVTGVTVQLAKRNIIVTMTK